MLYRRYLNFDWILIALILWEKEQTRVEFLHLKIGNNSSGSILDNQERKV